MFDMELIDGMYEAGRTTGREVQFCLFDGRMLLPLEQLPSAVRQETGEDVTVAELRTLAEDGWYPLLPRPDGDGLGTPLYSPSRIGLYLRLRRDGHGADELRVLAECEESMIAWVFTADELAYCDDDLETLVLYTQARIEALSAGEARDASGSVVDQSEDLAEERTRLEHFRRLQASPSACPEGIRKAAYRVRAINDITRVLLLNDHRAEAESGYSPSVAWTEKRWLGSADARRVEMRGIRWAETIRTALAQHEGDDAPPIRVPGFVMRGDRVVPTRTLTPAEYEREWARHNVDGYLLAWGEARGERRCLHCLAPLPDGADARRRFCGERCRNAAKQRRFRERNPEAADRARKRYWDSVELDEE